MGASSRASNGRLSPGPPWSSSDARDHRIPQKSSGDVLFSPERGSFFADSQNTEVGVLRDRAGEGHCSIPDTPSTPEGPLPLLEKEKLHWALGFGCGREYSVQQTDWTVWARCPQDLSWEKTSCLLCLRDSTRIRPGAPVLRWTRKGAQC